MSRNRRIALLSCTILAVAGLLWLAVALGRLWQAATAVQADLRALDALVASADSGVDPREAVRLLYTIRADLDALDGAARPFLWLAPYLGWVPRYGADIQAAPALLEIGRSLSSVGQELVTPLLPLLIRAADSETSSTQSLLAEALIALEQARPQLVRALGAVREAQDARASMETVRLSTRVQGWVNRLDQVLPAAEAGIAGALVLPEVLGAQRPRTYLVLVQNEDELRATGGFISGVVRVSVAGGAVAVMDFEDSYAVDDLSQAYPEPPAPLRAYMLSDLWLFRDSNWSPDYPTSARVAIDLYATSRGGEVDGVIGLDQRAIQALVGALEPLYVEGTPQPVTGDNVIQVARQAWNPGTEPSGEWWQHRKDTMGAVLAAAAQRLAEGLSQSDLARLGQAVLRSLDEKHVLVYAQDPAVAAWLSEMGWDGAVRRAGGDLLLVVDTNMGFNKANALVETQVEYQVDLSDLDRPRSMLSVRHHHTLQRPVDRCVHEPRYDETYEQMMERCYWDYLRVIVPQGARLLSATPHAVAGAELLSGQPSPAEVSITPTGLGYDVLGTFLLLRPGETVETRFEYALPESVISIADGVVVYELVAQKQPGTDAVPLRVRVTVPVGAEIRSSTPAPAAIAGRELEYVWSMRTDQRLRLVLSDAGDKE